MKFSRVTGIGVLTLLAALGCSAGVDSDGDGLSDAKELELGTSPDLADTDGDGVHDGKEWEEHTDPRDPKDFAGAPHHDAGDDDGAEHDGLGGAPGDEDEHCDHDGLGGDRMGDDADGEHHDGMAPGFDGDGHHDGGNADGDSEMHEGMDHG